MTQSECTSYTAAIYIGGDYADAKRTCRNYCQEVGACVTVEPVFFAYTGGAEEGVRVGFINYPRFPAAPAQIFDRALDLADRLMIDLAQHSYSVVATDRTVFKSRRSQP